MSDEITIIRVVIPGTNVVRITTAAACIGGGGTDVPQVFFNPGGRLTTESDIPVSTSDRTSQGTLYYTPYEHNNIFTYSGTAWQAKTFSEISLSLSVTSGKNYDVFINSDATTLSLSAAWSSDTARLDALGTQDGVAVLSSDHTKLWLGTIRASGSNVTEDSGGGSSSNVGGKRFVWNVYNRVRRTLGVIDTTPTWSYTSETIRPADGSTGNRVEYVAGVAWHKIDAVINSCVQVGFNSLHGAAVGIGVDTQTSFTGINAAASNGAASQVFNLAAYYSGVPGLGYHFLSWNESGADTVSTFIGSNASTVKTGMFANAEF